MISKKIVIVKVFNKIDLADVLWIPQGGELFSTTYTWSGGVVDYSYGLGGWGVTPYGEGGTMEIVPPNDPLVDVGSLMIDEDFYYRVESYEDLYNNPYTYRWIDQTLTIHTPDGAEPNSYYHIFLGVGKGYSNHPGWYDDIYYDGKIKSIPSIIRSIDNQYKGLVSFEGGSIEFINQDGYFDNVKDLGIYGQKVKILFGEDEDNLTQVYEGIVESFNPGQETFVINTIDPRKLLNKKIANDLFDQQVFPNLNDSDKKKYVPLAYGKIKNVEVVCTNKERENLTEYNFKLTDRKIKSIDTVRVDGVEVVPNSTDLENGTFTLLSSDYTTDQDVHCDFQGYVDDEDNLIENPVEIIEDLLVYNTSAFFNDVVFDTTEWNEIKNSGLSPCNIYEEKPITIIDVIEKLCNTTFISFIILGDGRYTLKIRDTEKDPVKTIYISDQIDQFDLQYNTNEYISSCVIGYDKDYDEDEYEYFTDKTREIDLFGEYSNYNQREIETQLINEEDAETYATELLDFFGGHYQTITVKTKTQHTDLELEDLVDVELYGMSDGKDEFYGTVRMEITSLEYNLTDFSLTISGRYIKDITCTINLYKLLRFNQSRTYDSGAVSSSNGQLWRALKPTQGNLPEVDSEFWESYLSINWNDFTPYQTGQMVLDENALYIASQDNINKKPSESETEWTTYIDTLPQGPQGDKGEPGIVGYSGSYWENDYTYVKDEVCVEGGTAWVSLVDDNTNNQPSVDDGSNWTTFFNDVLPIGAVIAWTSEEIPNGYLRLDGSIIPIADYPKLFDMYGTKFGGDGITTFGLPNAQGLTLAGHGIQVLNGRIKGDDSLEFMSKREDELQYHWHRVYDGGGQSSSNGGYSAQTYYTNAWTPPARDFLEDTTNNGGVPRGSIETHGPQLLVNYVVKARHTVMNEYTDPNIDQRLVDIENSLTPAYITYRTDWIDLSSGKTSRTLLLTHNLDLPMDELDISVYWRHIQTGKVLKNGEGSTYSGASGYSFHSVNNLQIKFQHANQSGSGIYYDDDITGTPRWNNDDATYGYREVKIIIKPIEITGLKGEKGDPGISTVPGPQGPQGPQGLISPNMHFLPEYETKEIDVNEDKLLLFDETDHTHKTIHPKYLKDNFVVDIIGHNLYRQYILKMADGTYRFNCGSSVTQNLIGGNGRSDKVVHNQRWPLIYQDGCQNKTIKQIDARGWMAAVLYDDGDLYTIGYNYNGQLGIGNNTNQYVFQKSAENVNRFWLSHYQGYHSQHTQTFIEKTDGSIWGCGHNANATLGLGNTTSYNTWQQITFFNDKEVIELYPSGCYHAHSLATTTDGSIWFCGYNGYGQCGDGSTAQKNSWTDITTYWGGPTTGPAGNIVQHVAGHGYYGSSWNGQSWMGMLREDGVVRMAGDNDWGQLGAGLPTGTNYYTPQIVETKYDYGTGEEIVPIIQLCSIGDGVGTLYARSADNKLWRWGYNSMGQLGDGTSTNRNAPYISTDSDDIDHHCKDILINDSNSYTNGHYSNQFITDDRNSSVWGVGYNGEYRVPTGQGNGNNVLAFTRLAFDKDVKIVKARQLGETTTSRFTIFLDDKGRAWFSGSNTSYQMDLYATSPTVPKEIDVN